MVGRKIALWKHIDQKNISLHDCRATRAMVKAPDLYFTYPDGFWVTPANANNPSGKTLKTDASQLRISKYAVSQLYCFKEFRISRRLTGTRRIPLTLETLLHNLNNGNWTLEFLDTYHKSRSVLFQCWLWSKCGRQHMERQLIFDCDSIAYLWNMLREDRPW